MDQKFISAFTANVREARRILEGMKQQAEQIATVAERSRRTIRGLAALDVADHSSDRDNPAE